MDDPETLTITAKDTLALFRTDDAPETTINQAENIRIIEGVPITDYLNSKDLIRIPHKPFVFKADQLVVTDRSHNRLIIDNVNVLMGHAYKQANNHWRFSNGQDVAKTVEAYDQHAKSNNSSLIEFIIACAEERQTGPFNIRVGQFDIRRSPVAYAVGEKVGVTWPTSHVDESGEVILEVNVQGNFFGLEELKTYKAIRILSD